MPSIIRRLKMDGHYAAEKDFKFRCQGDEAILEG